MKLPTANIQVVCKHRLTENFEEKVSNIVEKYNGQPLSEEIGTKIAEELSGLIIIDLDVETTLIP